MINFRVNNRLEISLQKIGKQAGHQFYKTFSFLVHQCSCQISQGICSWQDFEASSIF
jgi:hypothetical protein